MTGKRGEQVARIRADYDAAVEDAKKALDAPSSAQHSALLDLNARTTRLFGQLVQVVAELDEEVVALRKEVKRLKKH